MKLVSVNPDWPLRIPYWSAITSITTMGATKNRSSTAIGADMNASGRSRLRRRERRGTPGAGTEADSISEPPRS